MFFIPKIKKNFYTKDQKQHFSYCLSWFGFEWGHSDIIYRPLDQPGIIDLVNREIEAEEEDKDVYLGFSYDGGWTWDFAKLPPAEVELDCKLELNGKRWQLLEMPEQGNWSIIYADKFIAIKQGVAAYSVDGISWTSVKLPVDDEWLYVTYTGGIIIATSDKNKIFSYDGRVWEKSE